jgi:hypothetical protein
LVQCGDRASADMLELAIFPDEKVVEHWLENEMHDGIEYGNLSHKAHSDARDLIAQQLNRLLQHAGMIGDADLHHGAHIGLVV